MLNDIPKSTTPTSMHVHKSKQRLQNLVYNFHTPIPPKDDHQSNGKIIVYVPQTGMDGIHTSLCNYNHSPANFLLQSQLVQLGAYGAYVGQSQTRTGCKKFAHTSQVNSQVRQWNPLTANDRAPAAGSISHPSWANRRSLKFVLQCPPEMACQVAPTILSVDSHRISLRRRAGRFTTTAVARSSTAKRNFNCL